MDLTTLVETTAPTPFGWVITTQTAFDLNTVLAFRSQLASMSKFFENQKAVAPTVIGKRTPVHQPEHQPQHHQEEEETLEPVPLKVA
jgi:hypothetical protein